MTWFNCACGEPFEDRDDELCPSGINIRLSALNSVEREISIKLDEYFSLDQESRHKWAKDHLGTSYTPERSRELIEDIISSEINRSNFSATYECPSCGKIGIKNIHKEKWEFYEPI